MLMRSSLTLLLAAAMLCMGGCYYDKSDELYGPQCDVSDAGFNSKIKPILDANCGGGSCHGAGGDNGELVSYDQINAIVQDGSFRDQVIVTRNMPDGGSLSSCELDLITKWLDAGAPND